MPCEGEPGELLIVAAPVHHVPGLHHLLHAGEVGDLGDQGEGVALDGDGDEKSHHAQASHQSSHLLGVMVPVPPQDLT